MTREHQTRVGLILLVSLLGGVLLAGLALPAVGGAGVALRAGVQAFDNMPDELKTPPLPERSRILAADGSVLATFYYEDRVAVPLAQIAPVMRQAIIGIEDARFYEHGGIDIKGTLRALVTNTSSGDVQQGGSTLTQQYVKNVLIETQGLQRATERSIARKVREARYAMALEKRLSKDQILNDYLNIAYFGDGAYGVYSAAMHYFSTPPSRLSLAQAATLAGLVRDPSAFDPVLHPKAGRARRDVVLRRMAQLKIVPQAQVDAALRQPLGLHVRTQKNGCEGSSAPYFCDYVLAEIENNPAFGATRQERTNLLLRGGLTIHTTLQPSVQVAAQQAVLRHVPPGPYGAAEAVVEPGTGAIRAIAVNEPYGSGHGQSRIDLATDYDHGGSLGFQSGSTFKIFTLAAALSQGIGPNYTMFAPKVLPAPTTGFSDCAGHNLVYTSDVHNAEASEGGTFTLRQATEQSVNTFFVELERKTGLCAPAQFAAKAGMHLADGKPITPYPSFTLGVYEVSPLTLANAYATFAAHGLYCTPYALTKVLDRNGRPIPVATGDCHQTIDPGLADSVTNILQGVIAHGTGTAAQIGRPAAGKTGTVESFSAAWFCGYVPQLASCVWLGFPNGAAGHSLTDVSIGGQYFPYVYGASIPAPIWGDTMRAALQNVPVQDFATPTGSYLTPAPPAPVAPVGPPTPAAPAAPATPAPTTSAPPPAPAPAPTRAHKPPKH